MTTSANSTSTGSNVLLDVGVPGAGDNKGTSKYPIYHWLNVPLGKALAGIPMDARDEHGKRRASGTLLKVFDFLIESWKDLPTNTMNDVVVNGVSYKYYHVDPTKKEEPEDLGITLG